MRNVSYEELLGAIGRAWCAPGNTHKEMDATLAQAIADEIRTALYPDGLDHFSTVLTRVINAHSRENGSDTPDFILSGFLVDVLLAWDRAMQRRTEWYRNQDIDNGALVVGQGASDEDRRDAERYRRIRDVRNYSEFCETPGDLYLKLPDALDAALDAAIKGATNSTGPSE